MVPPCRVLEINVISAHDLALVSKNMKTYATAWIDPDKKLTTRVDQSGLNNPSWNEKFVFRVDDGFLSDETSAILIEIYAAAWLKDALIGSVRVLISHLFGSLTNNASATRFVALQVRRPSGRPQGILNMGISLLDNTMRSMPLLADLCAAGAAFTDESSATDAKSKKVHKDDQELSSIGKSANKASKNAKLRRSQSDRTDLTREDHSNTKLTQQDNSVRFDESSHKGSSQKGGSSHKGLVRFDESSHKGSSHIDGSSHKGAGSSHNGSVTKSSAINDSLCSSDVGPSASVVAAAIAKGLYKTPTPAKTPVANEGGNMLIIGGDMKAKQTEESLKAKVERWRTEVPPIYDHSKMKATSKRGGRARRKTDGGGLFSCFGNAFGCEISITCGGGNSKKRFPQQNGKVCHLSSVDDSINSQSYGGKRYLR